MYGKACIALGGTGAALPAVLPSMTCRTSSYLSVLLIRLLLLCPFRTFFLHFPTLNFLAGFAAAPLLRGASAGFGTVWAGSGLGLWLQQSGGSSIWQAAGGWRRSAYS